VIAYIARLQHAIYVPPFGAYGDVHVLVDLAQQAEAAGWDGFFLWDHLQYEQDVPFVDAWIALTAIAASTSTIRFGPLVTPLPRRRPWKVAREAVTLDHFSGGRLVLGVGLGIDFWREYSAFAEPATDDAARAGLVDDGIEIIDRLWSGERVDYTGRHLTVDGARFLPRPLQQPRIPIWSAMIWPATRPGPIRRAARSDGLMPFKPGGPFTPSDAAQVREVVARERGDDTFDLCLWGERDRADEFADAGVTWLIATPDPDGGIDDGLQIVAAGPPRR
jgi:alkanesulfonate monooxygenase SsuD/methylene tetrahydromethanopterin reductase-like flavin-dependent oxidoreductase (luciferase family)